VSTFEQIRKTAAACIQLSTQLLYYHTLPEGLDWVFGLFNDT